MHVAWVGFEVALSERMHVERVQLDFMGLASQRDPFERDADSNSPGARDHSMVRQYFREQDLWEMPGSGGQQRTGTALASTGGSLLHTCSGAGWTFMAISLPVFPRWPSTQ